MDKEIVLNLCTAVSNGRTDVVRTLLSMCENGAANSNGHAISSEKLLMEICNSAGTLLHLATKLDHIDIVRTLLSSGAVPNIENGEGETAFDLVHSQSMTSVYVDELLKCAAKSELDRIQQLIKAGVDVNSQDSPETKNTALQWAVCFGKPEAVQCLLEFGANPNVVNGDGVTPLHEAVKRKNVDIIKLLLSARADPHFKRTTGKYADKSPMELAENNEDMIRLFFEYVVDPETKNMLDNGISKPDVEVENLKNLSTSLQSLNTSSEPSKKSCLSQDPLYVPPFLQTPLPLITHSKLHLLWPQPQKIVQTDEDGFRLTTSLPFTIIQDSPTISVHSIVDVWNIHRERFEALDVKCEMNNVFQSHNPCTLQRMICHLNPRLFNRTESYKLIISSEQIRIFASDLPGLHYALCTLEQLFNLYSEDKVLPSIFIHDWPELQHRAVLLDFLRNTKELNLITLKEKIKVMSSLKINQLHYYCGHNLQGLWLRLSKQEWLELSRFCTQHFISLVPCIDVEDITPPVNGMLKREVEHLTPMMLSKSIHMGPKLSEIILREILTDPHPKILKDLCLPPATLVFLCYNRLVQLRPHVLQELPFNCVLIDYGDQVEHDFEFNTRLLTYAGLNVCLGMDTVTWDSIAGTPETVTSLLHRASTAASLHGAFGMIVADWKISPLPPAFSFSWPAILVSLGLSWNTSVHEDYLHSRLPELLNHYVYLEKNHITGYVTIELGRLEAFLHQSVIQKALDSVPNLTVCPSSILHQVLMDADSVLLDNFTPDLIQQVIRNVKKFEIQLQKAEPTCFHHGKIILELKLAMDLLTFACKLSKSLYSAGLNPSDNSCGLDVINVGINNLPPIARTDLANRLLLLIEQFRAVNEEDSSKSEEYLNVFNALLTKLIPENGYITNALTTSDRKLSASSL